MWTLSRTIGLASGILSVVANAANQARSDDAGRKASYISVTYPSSTTANDTSVELSILTKSGERNKTAPLLYGWMFEDINHSGDGGIYGELLANRAFQGSMSTIGTYPGTPGTCIVDSQNPLVPFGPTLNSWRGIGDVRLSLNLIHPLSETLPTVMEIDILEGATGEVGFLNDGWWGIDVSPQQYNASFFVLASSRNSHTPSHIDVSLRSFLTGEVWSTASVPLAQNLSTFEYMQFSTVVNNNATAPNSNNTFAVTFDASEVAGATFYFGLISLFPETYMNRPNGLRKDLAERMKALQPKFLRFPGGNNLEGFSTYERWKWWQTIGPLKDRKGRVGTWDYENTNGLGLLEFLEWCEDMDMEPVLAIYSGYSLAISGFPGASFPPDDMHIILQEAIDELEYCMGDISTNYGALRASHGHPAAFKINYVEIGNEDFFSSTYPYRFPYIYNGLKKVYPDITYISTAFDENPTYNISIPKGNTWDAHYYLDPIGFLNQFNQWDNWQQETGTDGVTVFVGEYSVYNFTTPSPEVVLHPRLISACAEAVYLLGMERNPNVVRMSSYAPSFRNQNWNNFPPNLIDFTADPRETVLSVSYYSQKLFNSYRGTETLTVTNSKGDFDPLWWAASIHDDTNIVYLKVVNTGQTGVSLQINLETSFTGVNGTIITGDDPWSFNSLENKTTLSPMPLKLNLTGGNAQVLDWHAPHYSITVLQFDLGATDG